jgi:glycosyltransferase involved in cell wall biosynthesis
MFTRNRPLLPLEDRGPLHVMFITTSMPVGGAETLLVELIRRMDRNRFLPELCCTKELGPLGETLSLEVPAFSNVLVKGTDIGAFRRLVDLFRRRRIDAVVTVGAGDKMFWGRLAARWAGLPVITSALHSTGHPDRVQFANKLLAPITDAFIAVAEPQAEYLAAYEGCPKKKLVVIPNGVDVDRFCARPAPARLRAELDLPPGTPVVGIVAALRPEKNHALLLRAATRVLPSVPNAKFLIVGDGPRRAELEQLTAELGIAPAVRFAGTCSDVPSMLSLMDVLALTSHIEANPVSILEAMAAEKPVVATDVGSVSQSVVHGKSGYLVAAGDEADLAMRLTELLKDRVRGQAMGRLGRAFVVENASIQRMIDGYQSLLANTYQRKATLGRPQSTGSIRAAGSEAMSDAGLGFPQATS